MFHVHSSCCIFASERARYPERAGGGGEGGRGCSNPGGNCGIQAIKTVTILLTNIWCLDE